MGYATPDKAGIAAELEARLARHLSLFADARLEYESEPTWGLAGGVRIRW